MLFLCSLSLPWLLHKYSNYLPLMMVSKHFSRHVYEVGLQKQIVKLIFHAAMQLVPLPLCKTINETLFFVILFVL